MKRAGEIVSETLSKLAKNLALRFNIGILINNNVGLQVYFFQPTARNKQATEESGASAAAVAGFIGFLAFLAFFGSLATLKQPSKMSAPPSDNIKKETSQVEQQQEQEYAMRDTAAQTIKTRTSEFLRPNSFQNRLGQNEEAKERENSLFTKDQAPPKLETIQEEESDTILRSYFRCFSIQDNLEHLISPKRNKLDDPELDVIEAMKVITLCWGIIMYSSLYALTST